jgi:uncharacterized membrane protein YphA (DoxX/SURF4 family)
VNIALWIAQVLLAVVFMAAGVTKTIRYERARREMAWVRDVAPGLVRIIGVCELLGGIGLIIPPVTHILPLLTPAAAASLAVVQILAFGFHSRRREWQIMPVNLGLLALAGFAAYGRMIVAPF